MRRAFPSGTELRRMLSACASAAPCDGHGGGGLTIGGGSLAPELPPSDQRSINDSQRHETHSCRSGRWCQLWSATALYGGQVPLQRLNRSVFAGQPECGLLQSARTSAASFDERFRRSSPSVQRTGSRVSGVTL